MQQDSAANKSSLRATVKDQSGAGKLRIGELLRKQGYITSSQLEQALEFQKKHKARLGSILIRLGFIEEDTILNVLTRMHNFPAISISREPPQPDALKLIPFETAKKYMAFPLRIIGRSLQITMAEPTDTSMVEELQGIVKMGLSVCVSTEKDIVEAYQKYYKFCPGNMCGYDC